MSLFIGVAIIKNKCLGILECGQCIKTCPVSIFDEGEKVPVIVHDNEDECTLCDLCLTSCPTDAVEITKLYENKRN